jgi:hypothetical protein
LSAANQSESAVVSFPGLTARVRSEHRDILAHIGRLFALGESALADVEYSVTSEGEGLTVSRDARELRRGVSLDAALVAIYGELYEQFVSRSTHFLVHAGSVATDRGAFLMPGAQESGKSTLTLVLACQGARAISDDVAVIDPAGLSIYPYPRRLLIRPQTFTLNPFTRAAVECLCTLDEYGELVHIARPVAHPPTGAVPIRAIVFPNWADRTEIVALSSGETAARLLDNSLNLRVLGEQGVLWAARLARCLPGYALAVSDPSEAARLLLSLDAS